MPKIGMFMKKVYAIFLLLMAINAAKAQGYTQAVGIRAGWISPGIEYRYYFNDINSMKALLAFRNRGVQLHALAEFHQYDLFPFSYQLQFFYGAGAHVGFESWDYRWHLNNTPRIETRSSLLAGIDGLIGLEYVFYSAPVVAGFEVKPYLDLFGRYGIYIVTPDFALTFKYLF